MERDQLFNLCGYAEPIRNIVDHPHILDAILEVSTFRVKMEMRVDDTVYISEQAGIEVEREYDNEEGRGEVIGTYTVGPGTCNRVRELAEAMTDLSTKLNLNIDSVNLTNLPDDFSINLNEKFAEEFNGWKTITVFKDTSITIKIENKWSPEAIIELPIDIPTCSDILKERQKRCTSSVYNFVASYSDSELNCVFDEHHCEYLDLSADCDYVHAKVPWRSFTAEDPADRGNVLKEPSTYYIAGGTMDLSFSAEYLKSLRDFEKNIKKMPHVRQARLDIRPYINRRIVDAPFVNDDHIAIDFDEICTTVYSDANGKCEFWVTIPCTGSAKELLVPVDIRLFERIIELENSKNTDKEK